MCSEIGVVVGAALACVFFAMAMVGLALVLYRRHREYSLVENCLLKYVDIVSNCSKDTSF